MFFKKNNEESTQENSGNYITSKNNIIKEISNSNIIINNINDEEKEKEKKKKNEIQENSVGFVGPNFNIKIEHLIQNLNKINNNSNIPKENNGINFNVPVFNIKKNAMENKIEQKGTDFTSGSYSIEDYDIYYDFEENEENENDNQPIFNIPIQSIKNKK